MPEEPSCSGITLQHTSYLNHGASLPSPLLNGRPGPRCRLFIEVHHVQKTPATAP